VLPRCLHDDDLPNTVADDDLIDDADHADSEKDLPNLSDLEAEIAHTNKTSSHEELRCVLAVIRHGDRTPKQKLKLKVQRFGLLWLQALQRLGLLHWQQYVYT
jgi:hypothetical protein